MIEIEVNGRWFVCPTSIPVFDTYQVREMIAECLPQLALGDTVQLRLPRPFKPLKSLFDGIIGWDDHGPIREPEPTYPFTFTKESLCPTQ